MSRPLQTWLLFAASILLAFGALAWITRHTLNLERERAASLIDADLQENLRLALWRIDSAAAGVLLRETSRPPEEFRSFSNAWNELTKGYAKEALPSPLINTIPTGTLLHFEISTGCQISSPQAPEGSQWETAKVHLDHDTTVRQQEKLTSLRNMIEATDPTVLQTVCLPLRPQRPPSETSLKSLNQKRSANFNQQAEFNGADNSSRNSIFQGNNELATPSSTNRETTPFVGNWLGDQLILTRSVRSNQQPLTQGVWLDWPQLKSSWEALVSDLLPSCTLVPVGMTEKLSPEMQYLKLASLPVRLQLGSSNQSPTADPSLITNTLFLGWLGAGIAALAVGILLSRTIALSERRAAFVSAVTHELRTPLTTFQLYTEMLVQEMIPDAQQQKTYLQTLHQEAGRLNHLVENVLSFARLERGSARSRVEMAQFPNIWRESFLA